MQGSLFRIERSWIGGEGLVFVDRVCTREREERKGERERAEVCVLCAYIHICVCASEY